MLPLAHVIFVKHNLEDPVEQNRTILKAVRCGCSDEEKNDSCKASQRHSGSSGAACCHVCLGRDYS